MITDLPRPADAEVQRVVNDLGLDPIQARNHLIGRELIARQIQADRAAATRRCIDAWTASKAAAQEAAHAELQRALDKFQGGAQ